MLRLMLRLVVLGHTVLSRLRGQGRRSRVVGALVAVQVLLLRVHACWRGMRVLGRSWLAHDRQAVALIVGVLEVCRARC